MDPEQDVFEFGRFRLLAEEGILLCDGEPTSLPPKALDTLLVLVRQAGHVVPKAEIIRAVWPDAVVEEANLTQNISTLRKVLDEGESGGCIETYPKRGYRFAAPVQRAQADARGPLARRQPSSNEPIQRSDPGARAIPGQSEPSRKRRFIGAALVAGAVLVTIALSAVSFYRAGDRDPAAGRLIVAVLPFENLSGDAGQDYISDGLTEETIAQLGRLNPERLGVIARTSVMGYKDDRRSIAEIGGELGVRYLLESSVRRDGERVRVTAQLVDAYDQSRLWSEEFESDWTGLIEVQKAVGRGIARTLAIELLPGSESRLAGRGTTSAAAYEAYLKGRYFWNLRDPESFYKSLDAYEEALSLDPEYAAAWAGLADTYLLMRSYNLAPSEEMLGRSEAAALKAIELDPYLVEAHTTLAGIAVGTHEWTRGFLEFQRAIELDPSYVTARQWYAANLALVGRFDESIAEMEQARQLDPLSPRVNAELGRMLYFARRYDEAIARLRSTLELAPSFGHARFHLGLAYLEVGRNEEAVAEIEVAAAEYPSAFLGYAYARGGRGVDATAMLARLEERWEATGLGADRIALVYVGLGDSERAFEWLYRAFDDESAGITSLQAYPYWDPLRDDRRYGELLRRLNFPD